MHGPLSLSTAPNNAVEIVTLDELKAHCRVPFSDHDVELQSYLDTAISDLDGYYGQLHRCLIQQVWEEKRETLCKRLHAPFNDVISAQVFYLDSDGIEQEIDSANFAVENARVRFSDDFTLPSLYTDTDYPVRVLWTCGFGETPESVPEQIRLAVKMIAAHWYENREAAVPNDRRVEYDLLPLGVQHLLSRFRVYR